MVNWGNIKAKLKAGAVQTGRGFVGLASDTKKYITEPVPSKGPRSKKIPRYQKVLSGVQGMSKGVEDTFSGDSAMGMGDMDFIGGGDLVIGPPRKARRKPSRKRSSGGGKSVHIHIHK